MPDDEVTSVKKSTSKRQSSQCKNKTVLRYNVVTLYTTDTEIK